ncbi:MAG: hypothetical protein Q9226_004905 [Calogaya cf. arnoldii]
MSSSSSDDYYTWQKPSKNPAPEPPGLTLERIEKRYNEVKEELNQEGTTNQLQNAFMSLLATSVVGNINKCVCTSLGSFTAEKFAEEDGQPNRPMYQLAAFEILKGCLEKHPKEKKKINAVRIQEPEMNSLDIAFVRSLGYEVIEDNRALEELARDVFLFTPGAEFAHVRDLFHKFDRLPAVYAGVDLVGWLESMKPHEKDDPKRYATLKEFLPENEDEYNKLYAPYIGVTTSQKLLIMNDKYPLPSVVAYVAKKKW